MKTRVTLKCFVTYCGFFYSACDHVLKAKKEFKNLKKQGIQNIFIEINQIKLVFSMVWLMEILKIQQEEQFLIMLKDKAFDIAKIPKYGLYQRGLASMVYNFFDKKPTSLTDKSAEKVTVNNEMKQNEQLAEELHKPITKNF